MVSAPEDTKPRFAGYTLQEELNRGRLGTLYLAEDAESAQVLLRVVANLADDHEVLRERISLDLDKLARVTHPNVASPIDIGQHEDHLYYVLDYPGSTTLLSLVRESRPLGGPELLWLGSGLARGLQALHKVELFHGDLWPGKIAMTLRGPVIVELGWSRRFKGAALAKDPENLPADLRGLGASLVYAATGYLPRPGKELPDTWDPDVVGISDPKLWSLIHRLLGPAEDQPPLEEVVQAFSPTEDETQDGDVDPDLDSLLAAISGMGRKLEETSASTSLVPLESEDGEQDVAFLQTVSFDGLTGAVLKFGASSPERDAPPPEAHHLRDGMELEHVRVLGKGGMGVVYLVRDPNLGRVAALKLIRGSANATRIKRFQRETRVTALLDHPGIPPVYEAGQSLDGHDYLLMQYLEGESMADILDERLENPRPGDPEHRDLLHALVKVAEAMAFAHSRRIVHRDLKPANIMLGAFGEVFVMDWGLARDLRDTEEEDAVTCSALGQVFRANESTSGITQEGAIMGTLGYIPPEQARSERIDARADVFALGAMLVEIMTGKPPIVGRNPVELVGLTRAGQIETPQMRNRDLSPELCAIACKAIAPDRDARYASSQEFATDLQAYLEGRNVSIYSYRTSERIFRFARRHPTLIATLAVVLVAMVVGAFLYGRVRQQQRLDREARAQALIGEGRIALKAGRATEARTHFLQALVLDASSRDAVIGKHEAEKQKRDEAARIKRAADMSKVATYVEEGQRLLAKGDLQGARRAFEAAQAFDDPPPEAGKGLVQVRTLLAEHEAGERQRLQKARDAKLAEHHLEAGQAYLNAKRPSRDDYVSARNAFVKAIAFGSQEARQLLQKAEEGLVELRARQRQRQIRSRDRRSASRLVEKARQERKKRRYSAARTAYLQALAFDGGSKRAQRGLVEVDRQIQRRTARREKAKRRKSAALLMAKARTLRKRALEAQRLRKPPARIRAAYFGALVFCDKALTLAPRSKSVRKAKLQIVSEVATLLKRQGRYEFAEFLLVYGGVKDADDGRRKKKDTTVEFREADAVTVANAFGGRVHFKPTDPKRAFPNLRDYLRKLKDRYRVLILVRSRTSRSRPPKVYVTGFRVQVEDRISRTVWPAVRIPIDGGPYERNITVSPDGRVVAPFHTAHGLDTRRWERQVQAAVRRVIGKG